MIGGGDTGTDCVGTSLRHGCKSLTQLEILPKPPPSRAPDNPWPQWPKVYPMDYGQQEAAERFGSDPRVYSISTKKFEGDADGQVKAIHTVQIEWVKGANGQFQMKEVPGTETVRPAQLVLLAMGFLGPEEPLLKGAQSRAGPPLQHQSRIRKIRHIHPQSVCRRRRPPRAVARRLGHQRRPRRRPRMRPLSHGPHRTSLRPRPLPYCRSSGSHFFTSINS